MLIIFSGVLVAAVCIRGLETTPNTVNARGEIVAHYSFLTLPIDESKSWEENLAGTPYAFVDIVKVAGRKLGEAPQRWALMNEWVPLERGVEDPATYYLFRHGQRLPAIHDPNGAIADLVMADTLQEKQQITIQNLQVKKIDGTPYALLKKLVAVR